MEQNKILELQDIVFNQLKRLDDDKLMEEKAGVEILRGNTIANDVKAYLSIVAMNIKLEQLKGSLPKRLLNK